MVNRCTFFTFITTPPNQPEYLGTSFVLSPKARAALFRTLASNQLHCKNDFSHWGWRVFRAYGARRAPHNGHEGDTGYVFFEELGTLITLPNCWEVAWWVFAGAAHFWQGNCICWRRARVASVAERRIAESRLARVAGSRILRYT